MSKLKAFLWGLTIASIAYHVTKAVLKAIDECEAEECCEEETSKPKKKPAKKKIVKKRKK